MDRGTLHHIETWVFDLDNTLYPASVRLFDQIEARMAEFICTELDIDTEAAHELRRNYWRAHGTTLRGLMIEHGVAPARFLDHVHAIDLSALTPAPDLDRALGRLPGRKVIFTNADRAHAGRVLLRLGIAHHFEAVFDVAAADFRPKPDPIAYDRFVDLHRINPARSAMIEDTARNLKPAHALGMTTAWVTGGSRTNETDASASYIHHVVEDLAAWLTEIANHRNTAVRQD